MPIFRLVEDTVFPPPDYADPSGLIAVGGDLSSERLLEAYRVGIFPWYSEDEPILWWSPDPRFVLFPTKLKISKSMKSILKKNIFTFSVNKEFEEVIDQCAQKKKEDEGTWITNDIKQAYTDLHK